MPIVVNIMPSGLKEYEELSEGVHQAVLIDIVDEGIKDTDFGPKRRFRFVWQSDEADSQGFTKRVSEFLKVRPKYDAKGNLSDEFELHEASKLRQYIEKLTGKPLTNGFCFDSLIGIQKALIIEHSEDKTGKVWANVMSHMKPTQKVPVPTDYVRVNQRSDDKKPVTTKPAGGIGGRAPAAAILAPAQPIADDDIPF